MWPFSNKTDSPNASDVENENNAEYARGYEAGRTGNFIADLVYDGLGGASITNDQYAKGREQGVKDRDKFGK